MKALTVTIPLNAWQQRPTSHDIAHEIDRVLEHHTCSQIASLLNERGTLSGEQKNIHAEDYRSYTENLWLGVTR
jgi:hypothetical protein